MGQALFPWLWLQVLVFPSLPALTVGGREILWDEGLSQALCWAPQPRRVEKEVRDLGRGRLAETQMCWVPRQGVGCGWERCGLYWGGAPV